MSKLNKQLQTINDASLAKILFYKNDLQNFLNELDFYNIVFASNGAFVVLKNEFGISIGQIKNIKYSNSELYSLDSPIVYSFIPKPPLSLFIEILEMFKYINNKSKWELCVNVYYHKTNQTFHINIIDQTIGGATANYKYDEKFEMSEEYIRYLQIHSHNTMAANFSGTDNRDENYTALCYYGVVGKINDLSKFYNVDMGYRIWNGIEFVNIDFDDVFETGANEIQLQNNVINKLDNIIKISKNKELAKQNASKNLPAIFGESSLLYPGLDDLADDNFSIDNYLRDMNL